LPNYRVPTANKILFSRTKLPFPGQHTQDLKIINEDMCETA